MPLGKNCVAEVFEPVQTSFEIASLEYPVFIL